MTDSLATPAAATAPLGLAALTALTGALDALDAGPGWYESSRELRCGLDIRIGLPAEVAAGCHERLDEWIADCLRQRKLRPSGGTATTGATCRITASPSAITAIA